MSFLFLLLPPRVGFGMTIHKFQGKQAGPDFHIKRIVVHLGDISFESKNPGLLYTALSCAPTIDENNHGIESALFFTNLTEQLFMHSADLKRTDKKSKAMIDRDNWIQYLDKNENKRKFTTVEIADLIHWTQERIPLSTLNKCISNNSWRTKN